MRSPIYEASETMNRTVETEYEKPNALPSTDDMVLAEEGQLSQDLREERMKKKKSKKSKSKHRDSSDLGADDSDKKKKKKKKKSHRSKNDDSLTQCMNEILLEADEQRLSGEEQTLLSGSTGLGRSKGDSDTSGANPHRQASLPSIFETRAVLDQPSDDDGDIQAFVQKRASSVKLIHHEASGDEGSKKNAAFAMMSLAPAVADAPNETSSSADTQYAAVSRGIHQRDPRIVETSEDKGQQYNPDLWNSGSSDAAYRPSGSSKPSRDLDEKQTLFDDFASFAEASLGQSYDGGGDNLSLPDMSTGDLSDHSGEVSHDLLVSYLMSVGTERQVAEELAFAFMSQQSTNRRSRSTRAFAARPSQQQVITPPSLGRRVARSATTSKLEYLERTASARRDSRAGSSSVTSASIPFAPSLSSRRMDSSEDGGESSSRGPRNYIRAEEPGAVPTQGRAFGAPMRPSTPLQDSIEEEHSNVMVEATMVPDEPLVYADKLSVKHLFQPGPLRRYFLLGLVLLVAAVAVICSLLLTRSSEQVAGGNDYTIAPTSAPTIIQEEILAAAAAVSGWDALNSPGSHQYEAVGWLSTFDEVDHQGYGEAFVQRYIMVTFYFSTGGENYLEQENWLDSSLHECEWSNGVFCRQDISGTRVIFGMDLTRNGLSGDFPREIGKLSNLEFIRLPKNHLVGRIPESLFDLSNLQTLDLGSNMFTGKLPHGLENATELSTLDLSANNLTGTLPMGLYQLRQLRILNLSSNTISGTIDDGVRNLQLLVTLNLRHNRITGSFPYALASLQKLDFIQLDDNRLTGFLPNLDTDFVRRQEITLSHNRLAGTIPRINPAEMNIDFSLVKIQKVDVSFNSLTGEINLFISLIPTLRYIDYSGNQFTGTLPSLVGLQSLEFLAASENLFTGDVPYLLPNSLKHFDFSGNFLNSTIPTELCGFSELDTFLLSDNSLRGSIPTCIANLDKLRDFEVYNAGLTGSIPSNIDQLSDLIIFDISNNTITGTLPTKMGRLTKLTRLHANDNLLQGPLPSQLGSLTSLQQLYLHENSFTGSVPSTFGNLIDLENFTIAGNLAMSGNIPESMCSFTALSLTLQQIGCAVGCSCCSGENGCSRKLLRK